MALEMTTPIGTKIPFVVSVKKYELHPEFLENFQ